VEITDNGTTAVGSNRSFEIVHAGSEQTYEMAASRRVFHSCLRPVRKGGHSQKASFTRSPQPQRQPSNKVPSRASQRSPYIRPFRRFIASSRSRRPASRRVSFLGRCTLRAANEFFGRAQRHSSPPSLQEKSARPRSAASERPHTRSNLGDSVRPRSWRILSG
jgi:hypothetical protein